MAALPSCIIPAPLRGAEIKLAYGEAKDGTVVHISQVPSGLACGCICPGCASPLIARKGPLNVHHFGHHGAVPCGQALESALHKLAKQVLDEERTLLLPEIRGRHNGREELGHKERVHAFDDAVLEHKLDTIVPDVIVRKGDRSLLVEMYVTHRCGPEKIAKIIALGIPCVEIDLRKLPRDASIDEVRQALTSTARRHWVHNPKIAEANEKVAKKMADEAEAERIAREKARDRKVRSIAATADRIKPILKRPVRPSKSFDWTVGEVAALRLKHLIDIDIGEGGKNFAVPSEQWQSVVLVQFVLEPLSKWRAFGHGFATSNCLHALETAKCFKPGLPLKLDRDMEAGIPAVIPGYSSPYRAVENYLDRLESDGVLAWHRRQWSIARDFETVYAEQQRRSIDREKTKQLVQNGVWKVLAKIPEDQRKRFDMDVWWRQPLPGFALSFEQALDTDDHRITTMSHAVYRVENMALRNGEIVENLCGLPVATLRVEIAEARAREAERVRQAAIEKAEADRRARLGRLRSVAQTELGGDAQLWLEAPSPSLFPDGPLAAAATSEDELHRAIESARSAGRARRIRLEIEQLRGKLFRFAEESSRPDLARVFLTSSNPKWGNRHPIEYCVDDPSFERLKSEIRALVKR